MATARTEAHQQVSDYALIRRIVDGDEAALAAVYDRYSGVVYSVARRILRDPGLAEEVLQDIFYQLWRTASRFELGRGSLPGWLLVMARNRSIDRLRRNPGTEAILSQPVAAVPSLETAAAQNELISRVRTALERMSGAHREALEMAYFQGLTHSEIAARTKEPLGTVKTRLRSALQELRNVLTK